MSLPNAPIDPTLDPITGLPVGQVYVPQYQVPLASQPINLSELNAQGKQSQWLFPDNMPPVVARLQARDLTNPGNAQDLSTDGNRNLNVDIAAISPGVNIGGSGLTPTKVQTLQFSTGNAVTPFSGPLGPYNLSTYKTLYSSTVTIAYQPSNSSANGVSLFTCYLQGVTSGYPLYIAMFPFITKAGALSTSQLIETITLPLMVPWNIAGILANDTQFWINFSFPDSYSYIAGIMVFGI